MIKEWLVQYDPANQDEAEQALREIMQGNRSRRASTQWLFRGGSLLEEVERYFASSDT